MSKNFVRHIIIIILVVVILKNTYYYRYKYKIYGIIFLEYIRQKNEDT